MIGGPEGALPGFAGPAAVHHQSRPGPAAPSSGDFGPSANNIEKIIKMTRQTPLPPFSSNAPENNVADNSPEAFFNSFSMNAYNQAGTIPQNYGARNVDVNYPNDNNLGNLPNSFAKNSLAKQDFGNFIYNQQHCSAPPSPMYNGTNLPFIDQGADLGANYHSYISNFDNMNFNFDNIQCSNIKIPDDFSLDQIKPSLYFDPLTANESFPPGCISPIHSSNYSTSTPEINPPNNNYQVNSNMEPEMKSAFQRVAPKSNQFYEGNNNFVNNIPQPPVNFGVQYQQPPSDVYIYNLPSPMCMIPQHSNIALHDPRMINKNFINFPMMDNSRTFIFQNYHSNGFFPFYENALKMMPYPMNNSIQYASQLPFYNQHHSQTKIIHNQMMEQNKCLDKISSTIDNFENKVEYSAKVECEFSCKITSGHKRKAAPDNFATEEPSNVPPQQHQENSVEEPINQIKYKKRCTLQINENESKDQENSEKNVLAPSNENHMKEVLIDVKKLETQKNMKICTLEDGFLKSLKSAPELVNCVPRLRKTLFSIIDKIKNQTAYCQEIDKENASAKFVYLNYFTQYIMTALTSKSKQNVFHVNLCPTMMKLLNNPIFRNDMKIQGYSAIFEITAQSEINDIISRLASTLIKKITKHCVMLTIIRNLQLVDGHIFKLFVFAHKRQNIKLLNDLLTNNCENVMKPLASVNIPPIPTLEKIETLTYFSWIEEVIGNECKDLSVLINKIHKDDGECVLKSMVLCNIKFSRDYFIDLRKLLINFQVIVSRNVLKYYYEKLQVNFDEKQKFQVTKEALDYSLEELKLQIFTDELKEIFSEKCGRD